jgi:DNA-directed RNA polymerase subunit RPC12/RpoP
VNFVEKIRVNAAANPKEIGSSTGLKTVGCPQRRGSLNTKKESNVANFLCYRCGKPFVEGILDRDRKILDATRVACPFCGSKHINLAFLWEHEVVFLQEKERKSHNPNDEFAMLKQEEKVGEHLREECQRRMESRFLRGKILLTSYSKKI